MSAWDQFTGANAGYVYELFERYQRDPSSVDEATRRAFAAWTPEDPTLVTAVAPIPDGGGGDDHRAAIAAFTLENCVWGSDWPFVRLDARVDYGPTLACLVRWLPDEADRNQVLWETPKRLFGFVQSS